MRKSLQKLSVMALTGMLCMSVAPGAFAAGKAGSGRSVLSQYHADLANQRTELSELITDSKELTQQVKAAQHTLKEAGLITKSNCDRLAELSQAIKAKRLELNDLRNNNKGLRADAKDARLAGEMNLAQDALDELYGIQEQQIDLRTEIVKLLDQKLSYIYSIQNGTGDADDSIQNGTADADDSIAAGDTTATEGETVAAGDTTTAEGETVAAGDSTTTDTSIVTTDTSANAETGAAAEGTDIATTDSTGDAADITGETAAVSETTTETTLTEDPSADEIVTDEAVIDAALDDGAELE